MWWSIGLSSENWKNASPRGRLASLQVLENRLAQIQKRPPCQLRVSGRLGRDLGRIDTHQPYIIELNARLLKDDNPYRAVETVAHEGRHALQIDAVLFPDEHEELSQNQIAAWEDNFRNYLTIRAAGRQAYLDQPVEFDARTYSDEVIAELYTYRDRGLALDKAFVDVDEFYASRENVQNQDYERFENPDGWIDQPPISRKYDFEVSTSNRRWLSLDETLQDSDPNLAPDVETDVAEEEPQQDQAEPARAPPNIENHSNDKTNLEEPEVAAEEPAEAQIDRDTEPDAAPELQPDASGDTNAGSEEAPVTEAVSEPVRETDREVNTESRVQTKTQAQDDAVVEQPVDVEAPSELPPERPDEAESTAATESPEERAPESAPETVEDSHSEAVEETTTSAAPEPIAPEADGAVTEETTAQPAMPAESETAKTTDNEPEIDTSAEFAAAREAESRAPSRPAEPEGGLESARRDDPVEEAADQPETMPQSALETEAMVPETVADQVVQGDVEPETPEEIATENQPEPEPDAPADVGEYLSAADATAEPFVEPHTETEPAPLTQAEIESTQTDVPVEEASAQPEPAQEAEAVAAETDVEQVAQDDVEPEPCEEIVAETGPKLSPEPEPEPDLQVDEFVDAVDAPNEPVAEPSETEPAPATEAETDTSAEFAAGPGAVPQEAESVATPRPVEPDEAGLESGQTDIPADAPMVDPEIAAEPSPDLEAAAAEADAGQGMLPEIQPEHTDDVAAQSGAQSDTPLPEPSAPADSEELVDTGEALSEASADVGAETGAEPHPAPDAEVDTSPEFAAQREAAAQEAESRAPPPPPPPPPPAESQSAGMSM